MKNFRGDLSGESRLLPVRSALLTTVTVGCGGSIAGHPSAIPLDFARGFGKTGQVFSKSVRGGAPQLVSPNDQRQPRVILSALIGPTRGRGYGLNWVTFLSFRRKIRLQDIEPFPTTNMCPLGICPQGQRCLHGWSKWRPITSWRTTFHR